MKLPSCPRTSIINILKKNPDGLTLTSIAQLTGLHRHTATKYVYELKGAGVINERDVGSAKLCYLREGFSKADERKVVERLNGSGNWRKSSTGQVQLLTVFLFLFLIPATVIIAQNATQSMNVTLNATGLILGNESFENAAIVDNVSGENISAIMNETILPNEAVLGNLTDANLTEPLENLTANETALFQENISQVSPESNVTKPESNHRSNETVIIEPQNTVIEVRISSLDRITRGDEFDVSAVASNSGNIEARNVKIFWDIPAGFQIVSGASEADCNTIAPNTECTSSLTLSSSISTEIGKSQLKVKVKYEK